MSDDREFRRATTEWLEAGSDRTPPKAVDAVLLAIRTTRQDRVLRNPWRHIDMSTIGKALIAATAVVVIAVAWFNFAPSSNTGVGGPTPTPTPIPTPSPSPTPTAAVLPEGDFVPLVAGRYAFPGRATNPMISFSSPSGWTGNAVLVGKENPDSGPCAPSDCKGTNPSSATNATPFLFDQPFDHGFKNPCTDHTPVLPAAGSGAAGLLGVIAGQPGIDAGPVTDVSVGGLAGKYIDYTVTVDPATCAGDENGGGFWIWGTCPEGVAPGCEMIGLGDRRYGVSLNGRERAYAIDVNGKTYTFMTNQPADLTAADNAELQRVLDSIEFEAAG
jgi:hypothetical protein